MVKSHQSERNQGKDRSFIGLTTSVDAEGAVVVPRSPSTPTAQAGLKPIEGCLLLGSCFIFKLLGTASRAWCMLGPCPQPSECHFKQSLFLNTKRKPGAMPWQGQLLLSLLDVPERNDSVLCTHSHLGCGSTHQDPRLDKVHRTLQGTPRSFTKQKFG